MMFGAYGQLAYGQKGNPYFANSMTADVGAFTLTGQAVTFRRGLMLPAETGTFTLTGQDVTFDRDRILLAATGAFTLSGQDLSLRAARILYASHLPQTNAFYSWLGFGAYGQNAYGGSQFVDDTASATTFVLTGNSVGLRRGISFAADVGTFTLTGQDLDRFYRTYVLMADVGVFVLTGQAAIGNISMPAGAGTFVLTGHDVEFARVRRRMRGFARVGSAITARAA